MWQQIPKLFLLSLIGVNVDENLKLEIEFIIKSNDILAENKVKNKMEKLLSKYKHGNDINEHGKQQNERTT